MAPSKMWIAFFFGIATVDADDAASWKDDVMVLVNAETNIAGDCVAVAETPETYGACVAGVNAALLAGTAVTGACDLVVFAASYFDGDLDTDKLFTATGLSKRLLGLIKIFPRVGVDGNVMWLKFQTMVQQTRNIPNQLREAQSKMQTAHRTKDKTDFDQAKSSYQNLHESSLLAYREGQEFMNENKKVIHGLEEAGPATYLASQPKSSSPLPVLSLLPQLNVATATASVTLVGSGALLAVRSYRRTVQLSGGLAPLAVLLQGCGEDKAVRKENLRKKLLASFSVMYSDMGDVENMLDTFQVCAGKLAGAGSGGEAKCSPKHMRKRNEQIQKILGEISAEWWQIGNAIDGSSLELMALPGSDAAGLILAADSKTMISWCESVDESTKNAQKLLSPKNRGGWGEALDALEGFSASLKKTDKNLSDHKRYSFEQTLDDGIKTVGDYIETLETACPKNRTLNLEGCSDSFVKQEIKQAADQIDVIASDLKRICVLEKATSAKVPKVAKFWTAAHVIGVCVAFILCGVLWRKFQHQVCHGRFLH